MEPLAARPNVFVTATGTSFFSQCLPSGSAHLALSFTAMHWLSKQPAPISCGVHMTQLAEGPEKEAWAAQAAADWQQILLSRWVC